MSGLPATTPPCGLFRRYPIVSDNIVANSTLRILLVDVVAAVAQNLRRHSPGVCFVPFVLTYIA